MDEGFAETERNNGAAGERAFAYRILRYTPNLVRDEWVNIRVLLFVPDTGERRLRLIEEQDEFNRVRRLHPRADEALLRRLRDDLEDRFQSVNGTGGSGSDWQALLAKWDDTLSNALQLAPQKGARAQDLDAEMERLYNGHVALERAPARMGVPGSRGQMRSYCSQVFRAGTLVGAHPKARTCRRIYVSRRSYAHGLRLPAQWHARFRAHAGGQSRAGRSQEPGLYRRAHCRQSPLEVGVCGGNRYRIDG